MPSKKVQDSTMGKVDRIKQLEAQLAELRAEHEAEVASVRDELRTERNQLVSQAYALISKAESLSDQIGEGFNWDLEYGMGGYYDTEEGWRASSESC